MKQIVPIILTIIICSVLIGVLLLYIVFLNSFPVNEKILLSLLPLDILVGITIYLKTSIDFVIFIGKLMKQFPGITNRIAIELGTAVGNGLGTLMILTIWIFFKEVPILLILMILFAALILLEMAEESLEEFKTLHTDLNIPSYEAYNYLLFLLKKVNDFFYPITKLVLNHPQSKQMSSKSFLYLFTFSATVPFILGLDDFAGYIPLFSIINVFGFATGVFVGHMLLNILLFASPSKTVKLVTHPAVLILGGFAFIALAFFGFYESIRLTLSIFRF